MNDKLKNHVLQVNKMQFEERVDGDTEGRMFRVKSTDPRGPSLTYVCQAEDAQTRARCCLFGPFNILQMTFSLCSSLNSHLQVDGYNGKAAADSKGIPSSPAGPHCIPQQTVERAVSRLDG